MIVKLTFNGVGTAFAIWDKDGKRLYYSDKEKDVELAKKICHGVKIGYFQGYWLNKVVQIKKKVEGYSW